jgi:hypothetical protein
LKVDATGSLVPIERVNVYPPMEGILVDFKSSVQPGKYLPEGEEMIKLYSPTLDREMAELKAARETAEKKVSAARAQLQNPTKEGQFNAQLALHEAEGNLRLYNRLIEEKRRIYNVRPTDHDGDFWVKSPMSGLVLTSHFRQELKGTTVKPSQPLLRIGKIDPGQMKREQWEIELKIPQKHVGQVMLAFGRLAPDAELDVDLLLKSKPTQVYKGKLSRKKIASEATPDRTDNNEAEPVVLAWVRIHGDDIPPESRIPLDLLLTDLNVNTRIRCGNRAMGYSLFYGVWEFIYEKIVFFF